jgi:hypothetical protein
MRGRRPALLHVRWERLEKQALLGWPGHRRPSWWSEDDQKAAIARSRGENVPLDFERMNDLAMRGEL